MIRIQDKNEVRKVRHLRVRKKVTGTAERPRMNVYRSLNNIYVQIIDDVTGHTLVSASTADPAIKESSASITKKEAAKKVGVLAAQRAKEQGIEQVVFDRGGYLYTGRIAEVAAGARETGLDF